MTESNTCSILTVIVDESGRTTIYEPKVDPPEDLTPEMRAKLLAINERSRLRRPEGNVAPGNGSAPDVT
jgi:hypothetical protein